WFAVTANIIVLATPALGFFLLFFISNWHGAYWLLLFGIPLSRQIWMLDDSLSTSVPDEPMPWVFLLVGLVIVAWKPTLIPKEWGKQPIIFIVLLQYVLTFIALLYTYEHLFSVKFFMAKPWMMMAYFVLPIFLFRK